LKRLPNLDVLRFFLASLVVIYHTSVFCRGRGLPFYDELPVFHKGVEAVYMFFILSGFLIIRLIYKAKQRDAFSISKFYIRRILRIFPLYYLVLFFGFAYYHFILPQLNIPFEINYNLSDGLLLTVFFVPNIFTTLYDPGAIIQVLWSIGIEEQFYLFIAPLLFIIRKNWILKALVLLTIVYFGVYHLNGFTFLRKFHFVYYFLFTGGIVAILEERKQLEFLKSNTIIPICSVVLVLIYFLTNWFDLQNLILKNLIACIVLGLFVHTIACNNLGVIVKNRMLNYFGTISYGIYMYHVIIINAVAFLFLKIENKWFLNDVMTIVLINILTFVLTILIAHFSYKYMELRFLNLKNKFRE